MKIDYLREIPAKAIVWLFYSLFLFTPFILTSVNSELFEYNKMTAVYILTSAITAAWIIRMMLEAKIIFRRTFMDIPLLLFLISQIVSTIFSMDPHVSLWGYYSR